MSRPYPLIEYAQSIGVNTAEFTGKNLAQFMTWWLKQPVRKDIVNMKSNYGIKKFQEAQTSRLAEQGIESPINNGEEEVVVHTENEMICTMELTKVDVEALQWVLTTIFEDYELTGMIYDKPLRSLQEALKGV